MSLILVAFFAGALTILAPCTLPLLPLLFGGTFASGRKIRLPIVLIAFSLSVLLITLLLKVFFVQLPIDDHDLRLFSSAIFFLYGIHTLFPKIREGLISLFGIQQKIANILHTGNHTSWYEVILGCLLGPLFNSCSPTYLLLVATILPVHILEGVVLILVYLLGLCGMLWIFMAGGKVIATRLRFFAQAWAQKKWILGIVCLLLACIIFFGVDKLFSIWLIHVGLRFDTSGLELSLLQGK